MTFATYKKPHSFTFSIVKVTGIPHTHAHTKQTHTVIPTKAFVAQLHFTDTATYCSFVLFCFVYSIKWLDCQFSFRITDVV